MTIHNFITTVFLAYLSIDDNALDRALGLKFSQSPHPYSILHVGHGLIVNSNLIDVKRAAIRQSR